jgi:predicted enzyme related to lactoylglutathione lyase
MRRGLGRRPQTILPLVVWFLATGVRSEEQQTGGDFTGEIKPVIYVRDVEKSAPFYRDVLGFGFLGFANSKGEPYYAELVAADRKFGLHEPLSPAQEDRVGHIRLYFRVRDLEQHRSRILAHGGEPGEIRKTDWMDMFTVIDADGNEIVFAATDPGRHTSNPWTVSDESPSGGGSR